MALVTSSEMTSSVACAVSSSMFQAASLLRTWARALRIRYLDGGAVGGDDDGRGVIGPGVRARLGDGVIDRVYTACGQRLPVGGVTGRERAAFGCQLPCG